MLAFLVPALAACGGASGSGAVSPSPNPTSAATAEASTSAPASPSTGASPSAGATGGTLCTTGGSAATGTELTISDPDVGMNLPAGWEPMDIEVYGQLLAQAAAQVNDPRVTKASEWQAGLIRANVMRAAATGVSEPSGFQAAIVVSVLPVTSDLQTTIDMRLNDQATSGIPIRVTEVTETEVPMGPAYCAGFLSDIEIGTPSQTIEYVVTAAGGRAVSVGGTAPSGDSGFPSVVRSVALSLVAN